MTIEELQARVELLEQQDSDREAKLEQLQLYHAGLYDMLQRVCGLLGVTAMTCFNDSVKMHEVRYSFLKRLADLAGEEEELSEHDQKMLAAMKAAIEDSETQRKSSLRIKGHVMLLEQRFGMQFIQHWPRADSIGDKKDDSDGDGPARAEPEDGAATRDGAED